MLLVASCAERRHIQSTSVRPPAPAHAEPSGIDAPLVIVTLDGVRWQEVFDGTEPARSHGPRIPSSQLLPNLYAFGTERGAFVGAPGRGEIRASGPNYVSLPGYSELFSGRTAHGCGGNDCPRTTAPTLLDEARARGGQVAAFASWTRLDFALTSTPGGFRVACGPLGGSAEGVPDLDSQRSDYETANAALAYYEAERPDVFYLGLGETDEHAHFDNYAGYLAALRHADDVLGRLRGMLDRDERGRRTHVFVTADHGRARDFKNHGGDMPESARVWMVASGPRVAARGFVRSKAMRHLADLAPTARALTGLDPTQRPKDGVVLDELF